VCAGGGGGGDVNACGVVEVVGLPLVDVLSIPQFLRDMKHRS